MFLCKGPDGEEVRHAISLSWNLCGIDIHMSMPTVSGFLYGGQLKEERMWLTSYHHALVFDGPLHYQLLKTSSNNNAT